MNRYLVFCLLVIFSFKLLGDTGGIEETNYRMSYSVADNDLVTLNSFGAEARFPIAGYTGLSVSADYSDLDAKRDHIVESKYKALSLDVFVRDFDLGILTAGYTYTRMDLDTDMDFGIYSSKTISLGGALYLGDFDLSFERSRFDLGDELRSNDSSIGLDYYINDNFGIGVMYEGMDSDASSAFITYQPSLFGNTTSFLIGYTETDDDEQWIAAIAYTFNNRVSLKDKVRRY